MVSYTIAVEYEWLHIKLLERLLAKSPINSNWNYHATISRLPNYVLEDLTWWSHNILKASNKIKTNFFYAEIFTDASRSGWGATDGEREIHGF